MSNRFTEIEVHVCVWTVWQNNGKGAIYKPKFKK